MRTSVIVFPGSNCDRDVKVALQRITSKPVNMVWHGDSAVPTCDLIVLPGGFSYGDYLRCGAMAAHSPIMRDVIAKAKAGTPVLGICNGFQVLCESGLLPGILMRNASLKFVCRDVHLRVERADTMFTTRYKQGEVIRIPVAHGDGNYFAAPDVLARLKGENRVAFRYATAKGEITADANPNGAQDNIAGIVSESGRILGMMPHPERLYENALGGTDGRRMFESLAEAPDEDADEAEAEADKQPAGKRRAPQRQEPKDSKNTSVPASPLPVPASAGKSEDKPAEKGGAEVVRLDRFRKK